MYHTFHSGSRGEVFYFDTFISLTIFVNMLIIGTPADYRGGIGASIQTEQGCPQEVPHPRCEQIADSVR